MRKASAPQTLQQELDTKLALTVIIKHPPTCRDDGVRSRAYNNIAESAKAQIIAEYKKARKTRNRHAKHTDLHF